MASAPTHGEQNFLDALAPEQRDELRALGRTRRYPPGAALFREGDPGDAVYVVLSGRVKLSCATAAGRESILGLREAGDLIGEMAAIDAAPRSASAIALEEVEALAVPSRAFSDYLDRTPGVAMVLLRMVVGRLRDADRKRNEFVAHDTLGRVCARLVELAERFGVPSEDGTRIANAITQEELAGWTGSSREAVIKALRSLRDLGWITTSRQETTLHDLDALRRRGS